MDYIDDEHYNYSQQSNLDCLIPIDINPQQNIQSTDQNEQYQATTGYQDYLINNDEIQQNQNRSTFKYDCTINQTFQPTKQPLSMSQKSKKIQKPQKKQPTIQTKNLILNIKAALNKYIREYKGKKQYKEFSEPHRPQFEKFQILAIERKYQKKGEFSYERFLKLNQNLLKDNRGEGVNFFQTMRDFSLAWNYYKPNKFANYIRTEEENYQKKKHRKKSLQSKTKLFKNIRELQWYQFMFNKMTYYLFYDGFIQKLILEKKSKKKGKNEKNQQNNNKRDTEEFNEGELDEYQKGFLYRQSTIMVGITQPEQYTRVIESQEEKKENLLAMCQYLNNSY